MSRVVVTNSVLGYWLVGAMACAAEPAWDEPVLTVLARARDVVRVRSLLIADHVAWFHEAHTSPPEAIDTYRQKYLQSFSTYVSHESSEEPRRLLEEELRGTKELIGRRPLLMQAAVSPLVSLARPDLASWVVGLIGTPGLVERSANGVEFDYVEGMAVQVGRPASLAIVDRLRSEPRIPPIVRDRLLAILKKIEGDAADAVMGVASTDHPPDEPLPVRAEGRDLSFMLLPAITATRRQGAGHRTIARLSKGVRVADPDYVPADWKSQNDMGRVLGQLRVLGDVAVVEDRILVTSRSYEKLRTPIWVGYKKLPQLESGDPGDLLVQYMGNDAFVVKTIDADVAIVQLLGGAFNREMAIAYTVIRAGDSGISMSIPSPIGFVLHAKNEREYGEIVARMLCVQARVKWFFDTCVRSTDSLRDLLEPESHANDDERIAAIGLLGKLRSFESGDTLVGLIAGNQTEAIRAAVVVALARMTPHARHFFRARLKTAEGPSRERLLKAFRSLEGESVADFLLELWAKEEAK